jgi:hypothetical protein
MAGTGKTQPHEPRHRASNVTTDHEVIRRWAEERGGKPACVRGTGNQEDAGILRIDFPGYTGEDRLQPIEWDEWFDKFEERKLALVYQEETRGRKSNFNRLISREPEKATPPKTRAGGRTT